MLTAVLDTHLKTFHLDVKFSAEKGKTTVLLGESGAGKSTVLRLLAGLQYPEQGTHRDLLQYPRSSYVAELVGMNFFHGRVICCEAGATCTSMSVDDSVPLLTAEVTEASANRMELSEGKMMYATFKATEARAYT